MFLRQTSNDFSVRITPNNRVFKKLGEVGSVAKLTSFWYRH